MNVFLTAPCFVSFYAFLSSHFFQAHFEVFFSRSPLASVAFSSFQLPMQWMATSYIMFIFGSYLKSFSSKGALLQQYVKSPLYAKNQILLMHFTPRPSCLCSSVQKSYAGKYIKSLQVICLMLSLLKKPFKAPFYGKMKEKIRPKSDKIQFEIV